MNYIIYINMILHEQLTKMFPFLNYFILLHFTHGLSAFEKADKTTREVDATKLRVARREIWKHCHIFC